MATTDVPGANPKNGDSLRMGCWAEHEDGSLIFVQGTEQNRVIYSMFDMSKDPIVEYRDAMANDTFNSTFSWEKKPKQEKWTWHDKTPFPWDKIIKRGASDGWRPASAAALLTAAERVADSLALRGAQIAADQYKHKAEDVKASREVVTQLRTQLQGALNRLDELDKNG
jgi:hypothetical protein